MSYRTVLVLLIAVFVAFGKADVPQLRGRLFAARAQRQQLANPTPYPAAGFRPDRQFSFPQDQSAQNALEKNLLPATQQTLQRPDQLYSAPAAQNFLPQQQPQITYGAPVEAPQPEPEPVPAAPVVVESQRLTAAKSARLTNNREDQEEEDESRTDIEVDTNVEEKKAAAAQPAAPAPTATFVYYPAGAVGFVQPAPAAYSLPAHAPLFAKLQAQPAAFAAPQSQQFLAQPQFFQPQAAAYFGAQLRAW